MPKTPICGVTENIQVVVPPDQRIAFLDTVDAEACKLHCRSLSNATYFTWYGDGRNASTSGANCKCKDPSKDRFVNHVNTIDGVSGDLICDAMTPVRDSLQGEGGRLLKPFIQNDISSSKSQLTSYKTSQQLLIIELLLLQTWYPQGGTESRWE